MNSIFVYDFSMKSREDKNKRIAVIFCSQAVPKFQGNKYEIRNFFDRAMPPDEIFLIVSGSIDAVLLQEMSIDDQLLSVLPTPATGSIMRVVTFDHEGQLSIMSVLDGSLQFNLLDDKLSTRIREEGLRCIFQKRNGILQASTTHHYSKPSGKHCNQFVRAGNVMNTSSEINFIGLCLLPYVDEKTTHLYCDTSSINAAGYAISYLRSRFVGVNSDYVIDSFRSYEGLKDFDFVGASTALILISASTSGDLVEQILEKDRDVDRSKIVTLFYLNLTPSEGKVLCELAQSAQNPGGYKAIKSYAAEDCELCRKGSVCVKIIGDQFLPENPNVSEHLIRDVDAPQWLSSIVSQFMGKSLIKCYYNNEGVSAKPIERKREIFLDVAPIYKNGIEDLSKFYSRWKKAVAQNIPSSLSRIVYLDDEASKTLAELVKCHFEITNPGRKDQLIFQSASDVRKPQGIEDTTEGATVVVCGCMCTGRKLMSVSQSLRNIETGGAITYLIGVSRTPDQASFEEIRSNLTFGKVRSDYGFYCVESIQCRDNPFHLDTSWDEEEKLLKKLRDFTSDKDSHAWIDARSKVLGSVGSSRGLYNNVFWNASQSDGKSQPLVLRRGMAFLKFEYAEGAISQAEVYFAVSAILHRLRDPKIRNESSRSSSLIQFEHHRVLLAPECFYRFNDGVIQGALLRAADRAELDYKISPKFSERMREVVSQIFENWDNSRGEACGEFLFALATEKLQLVKEDALQLHEILEKQELSPELRDLNVYCKQQVERSSGA